MVRSACPVSRAYQEYQVFLVFPESSVNQAFLENQESSVFPEFSVLCPETEVGKVEARVTVQAQGSAL